MPISTYDYIIVGGGSAGSVLARRLSDDPGMHVCLLEAGPDDTHPFVRTPIGVGMLHKHRLVDWGYNTVPESGMANRELMTLRGKVLGGSSSTNFMAFTRGAPGDFDRWARDGAAGWSWNDVLPYFKRAETWEDGESATRGGTGPVNVVRSKTGDPLDDALLKAAAAAGYPVTTDYNSDTFGFGPTQFNLHRGRRGSAAYSYLRDVKRRPNLDIITNAEANRVLLSGTKAYGVEYERNGVTETAEATREVIVSGGSINSPQILMLSGIGRADHLREHGITPVVDLPVGDNLQDHLKGVLLYKRLGAQAPFYKLLRYDRIALAFVQAFLFGTGPGASVPLGIQGYIKSSPDLDVPDLEFMLRAAPTYAHPYFFNVIKAFEDTWGIDPVILHPKSRGTIRLNSADPRARARIHYNYFSDPADIAKMREGFHLARKIGEQAAFDAFRGPEISPGPDVTSDADIDAHLRATSATVSHPVSTCRMGSGENSVVDPELRVRGIESLRVVDASVFPDLVSAHTNAAVIMVAERAADLIRGRTPVRAGV